MKVSYKGIMKDLPPKLQEKLDAKFAKLSKLVDGRGEKQAHVVVTSERHLHKAEITLHVHNHQLVGIGADSDLFSAMSTALDRIEKQAAKQGAKWRDTTRRSEPMKTATAKVVPEIAARQTGSNKIAAHKTGVAPAVSARSGARVFRPNHHEQRKPITLEEALLEMEDGREYVAYRDADKQVVSILIRRRDGHYDLIET
jgi:putative sigma-54 modulation protein